jgi:hypothetical protein
LGRFHTPTQQDVDTHLKRKVFTPLLKFDICHALADELRHRNNPFPIISGFVGSVRNRVACIA